ncbi:hypothetical protein FE257_003085 [Aspergillus nanangensis]|uniref:Major facilitator superfamily (MFS) profile domain-containing protein n=1 Tax=Aspergillus nanangensis TaxID=2582783 RepID=A0AAD4CBZ1_ASPNN|nr:hypothetical protein FE257_003085 [Aspergillus nanangensis]
MDSEKKEEIHSTHAENIAAEEPDIGEDKSWEALVDEAYAAHLREHEMSLLDALKLFRWAVLWSLIPSIAIVMEGYDTYLITSFFGYPAFKAQFGQEHPGKGYQVAGPWQSALGAGGNIGCFFGALINGYLIDRLGFKKLFILGQILMCGFIFISFFGRTVALQVVGQVLCGIPWGIFATLGPAYISELCPMALRPRLTACVNMFFVMGEWSYRIPYAIQWVWPVPLAILGCFMPESPWWHVRRGEYDAALGVINRIMAAPDSEKARQTVAMMVHTNKMESSIEQGSFAECFQGINARRTEISCMALGGQVLAGIAFAYSPTYFFEQAGLDPSNTYALGLGGAALALVGTAISTILMHYLGRRIMYVGGMGLISLTLLVIGCLTTAVDSNPTVQWAQSVLCIVWLFIFSVTIGPMSWVVPTEVSSTRLRSKTVVLARNSYYVLTIIAHSIEPYMMNPTAWNWRGYTAFFWFGSAFLTFIWSYFRLPETKGRTFEELDIIFAARTPSRQFRQFQVDAYARD